MGKPFWACSSSKETSEMFPPNCRTEGPLDESEEQTRRCLILLPSPQSSNESACVVVPSILNIQGQPPPREFCTGLDVCFLIVFYLFFFWGGTGSQPFILCLRAFVFGVGVQFCGDDSSTPDFASTKIRSLLPTFKKIPSPQGKPSGNRRLSGHPFRGSREWKPLCSEYENPGMETSTRTCGRFDPYP